MINSVKFLEELKKNIEKINNIKFLTIFSNLPLKIKSNNNLVIAEVKGFKKPLLTVTLKVYVDKNHGYEKCLNIVNKIVTQLNSMDTHLIDNIQLLEINYDSKSQFFCQEIKMTARSLDDTDALKLTFGNETFAVQPNTILKIERQINKLGATLYGNQFFEFNKPLKQVEGSTVFNQKIFDTLLNSLNCKLISKLNFQNNIFNATLTELHLTAQKTINFKFLEALNEN